MSWPSMPVGGADAQRCTPTCESDPGHITHAPVQRHVPRHMPCQLELGSTPSQPRAAAHDVQREQDTGENNGNNRKADSHAAYYWLFQRHM